MALARDLALRWRVEPVTTVRGPTPRPGILDIAPYLSGEAGGLESVAQRLREITETVGFFYLKGHGIPRPFSPRASPQGASPPLRGSLSSDKEVKRKLV